MPLYDYFCDECSLEKEVTKPMSECSTREVCDQCGADMRKVFSAQIHFTGTKVKDAEYYPSLGEVVKNDYHRKELMKKHRLIEVGNEKPERSRYYTERHRKEKLAKPYLDD